jgi:DNA-binding CsgD family transcriptional regulator
MGSQAGNEVSMGSNNTVETILSVLPEEGVLLMNFSLQVIACDAGAHAILRSQNPRPGTNGAAPAIPEEILSLTIGYKHGHPSSGRTSVQIGGYQYICRAYVMEPQNRAATQPMVMLHLQRDTAAADAVRQIAREYDLTDREEQALLGLARGLTSKEVAEEMDISPHTVKAYVRLIMIKMGVSRRAAIVGKLLEYNGGLNESSSRNRRNA